MSGGFKGTGVGGSGGGGGVGGIWGKLTQLEINQDKILSRLYQLENVRDAKSEPESLPIGHSLSKEQISDKLLFNKQRDRDLKQIYELKKGEQFWAERHKELQEMYSDLRWRFDNHVEKQTARKCLGIVTKIKNEPLTAMSTSREWMVAICEDIEKAIKQEFDLK